MGRHLKLNDLSSKRICDAIRLGHSIEGAARAGRVDISSIYGWLAQGRAGEPEYVGFLEKFNAAMQEAEERCVLVLKSALDGEGDLKLAVDTAWKWLARRRPQEWAEQKGEPAPSDEEVMALVAKIRATGTGGK